MKIDINFQVCSYQSINHIFWDMGVSFSGYNQGMYTTLIVLDPVQSQYENLVNRSTINLLSKFWQYLSVIILLSQNVTMLQNNKNRLRLTNEKNKQIQNTNQRWGTYYKLFLFCLYYAHTEYKLYVNANILYSSYQLASFLSST